MNMFELLGIASVQIKLLMQETFWNLSYTSLNYNELTSFMCMKVYSELNEKIAS